MSKVDDLKELLLDTLKDQLTNGVTVVTKDGEAIVVDVGAPVLAVTAKVIKDWANEADKDSNTARQADQLASYLAKRRPELGTKAN